MPNEKRKRVVHGVSWLAAVVALISYCVCRPEAWKRIDDTPPTLLLLLCILGCATWFAVYLQSYTSLRALGQPPPFVEYLAIFCVSLAINYTPIRFGIAARAAYLSKFQDVRLVVFVAISVFRLLVLLFVAGSLASVSIILLQPTSITANLVLLSLFFSCVCLPVVLLACVKFDLWQRLPGFLGEWATRFITPLRFLDHQHRLKAILCMLILVQFLMVAIRMKLCFSHADLGVGYLGMIILAPMGAILSVITITPGGLGVREFAVASVCALLGYSFEQGMEAMIVDRISMICVAIVLGFGGFPKFVDCWRNRDRVNG